MIIDIHKYSIMWFIILKRDGLLIENLKTSYNKLHKDDSSKEELYIELVYLLKNQLIFIINTSPDNAYSHKEIDNAIFNVTPKGKVEMEKNKNLLFPKLKEKLNSKR